MKNMDHSMSAKERRMQNVRFNLPQARKTPSMEKIRFLHIPKCAGTSFSNCLKRIYGGNYFKRNYFKFTGNLAGDLERYRQLDAEQRSQLVMITGHAPSVTGLDEIDSLPTITFLRDPVERVKSFCQHLCEGKSLRRFSSGKFDLDELLATDSIELDNSQTRYLLGVQNFHLPSDEPETLVDKAMNILENRMACYGITEYFDESLILFHKTLAWKHYPIYSRLNQKNRSKQLSFSASQIGRIRELNQIDIRLYELAKKRFIEKLESDADYLRSVRPAFVRHQNFFEPLLEIYKINHKIRSLMAKNKQV